MKIKTNLHWSTAKQWLEAILKYSKIMHEEQKWKGNKIFGINHKIQVFLCRKSGEQAQIYLLNKFRTVKDWKGLGKPRNPLDRHRISSCREREEFTENEAQAQAFSPKLDNEGWFWDCITGWTLPPARTIGNAGLCCWQASTGTEYEVGQCSQQANHSQHLHFRV